MTNDPDPDRFDGPPPVYEPEKVMVASLSSIRGLLVQSIVGQTTEVQKIYYFINDHLGTPQKLLNENADVVWSADYKPFGEAEINVNTFENKFRYPGQYFDTESGLHYNYHRYYDPSMGRYLRADPIGLAGGINLYAYVGGNPVNAIDPFGLTALYFDRQSGLLFIDPERGQGMDGIYAIPATSGRGKNMNNPSSDHLENQGPIPSGNYTANINNFSNPGLFGDLMRRLTGDWGDWRVPLEPCENVDTERSGFFLHCGSSPGSAGCIDIGGGLTGNEQTDRLMQDLRSDPNRIVPVEVW